MVDLGVELNKTSHPGAIWLVYLIGTMLLGSVIAMFVLIGIEKILPSHAQDDPFVSMIGGVLGGFLALAFCFLSQGAPALESDDQIG